MRTRLVVLGIGVAVIALLLILWGLFRVHLPAARPTPASAPAAPVHAPPAAAITQRQVLKDIVERGLTPERAKLYFGMVVGPLPGVELPRGGRDPTEFDGTPAIQQLIAVWDSLTPEQQSAAARLIFHVEPAATQRQQADLLPLASVTHYLRSRLLPVVATVSWDYQAMATKAQGAIGAALNLPPIPVEVLVDVSPPPPDTTEWAHTTTWYWDHPWYNQNVGQWRPYPNGGCKTLVWDQKFQNVSIDEAQAIMTHEMFHCYQQAEAGSNDDTKKVPLWVLEGEADWAALTLVPTGTGPFGPHWNLYVQNLSIPFATRQYDAVGVFGHLSDLAGAGTVWPKLLPMVTLSLQKKPEDMLEFLIHEHRIDYLSSWASSYFVTPGQPYWDIAGPGSPPTNGSPTPQQIDFAPDTAEFLPAAGPYQSQIFQLSGSADILLVSLLSGYGRVRDENYAINAELDSGGSIALCLKNGGCTCPDGTAGASLVTKPATAPLWMGINGGETTAQVGIAAQSLDRFCKQKEPPQPPTPLQPSGGGGGGGGGSGPEDPAKRAPPGDSYGDTHLNTFDGVHYDFQVVGEYTLVRSTRDDFLVQIRQVPIAGPKVASVNQAVATRIGGQRMSFTLENGAIVVRIDGKPAGMPLPALKTGSLTGTTTIYGSTYHLTWPDGTLLTVEQLGAHALNAHVTPTAERHGALEGLLGNFDGSPDNDLLGAGDVRLGTNPSSDDLNHALADRWRVAKSESLFDYKPGQSSASFSDPNFPAKGLDLSKITNLASAESACRDQGVTDPTLLADCILDLAATNDFVFGSRYAQAQKVLLARAGSNTARPAPAERPIVWIEGEILDPGSNREYHFDAKAGDVIWVHDPDCVDRAGEFHAVFLSVIAPSGKRLKADQACVYGRSELPEDGTYTVRMSFNYRNETTHYRIPIRFVRPVRRALVAYGQSVSGNIEQRAARDIYSWTGKEGDIVVLQGEGCQLGWMLVSVYDSQDREIGGMGCRKGTYFKVPKDGTYQLVINSDNAAEPGPYRFVFQGGKLVE